MQSKKEQRASEFKEEIPMNNIASKLQQRRLNLWRSLKNQTPECLLLVILESLK